MEITQTTETGLLTSRTYRNDFGAVVAEITRSRSKRNPGA
jgi:hypothetical protein